MGYTREIFNDIIDGLKYDDIREYANKCLDIVPEYFYKVPASSSGKYHPAYALGEGGLVRHTLAVCKILKYILELECISDMLIGRQKDMTIVAGLLHDAFKCGTKYAYEENPTTKFEHPLIAKREFSNVGHGILPDFQINYITDIIASHMGQWNKRDGIDMRLPTPHTLPEILVHIADYLASRKDIIIDFGNTYDKPNS